MSASRSRSGSNRQPIGPRRIAVIATGDELVLGSTGSGDGQFTQPYGVVADATNLYVSEAGNHRVRKEVNMVAFLLVLLLVAILFGGGFALSFLWFIAAVVLVLWLIGFIAHAGERRWYHW